MVEICTNVGRWKEEGLGMLGRLGKGVCRLKRGQLVPARPGAGGWGTEVFQQRDQQK